LLPRFVCHLFHFAGIPRTLRFIKNYDPFRRRKLMPPRLVQVRMDAVN
jgi:hypothetical protein